MMHPNLNSTLVREETYPTYQTDLQAQSVVPQHQKAPGALKYRPGSLGLNLDLDPYPGLSGLFVLPKVPVQHPETDIGPSGSH